MFLWFMTYLFIPAYTILFVQDSNWFTTNFSVIGNNLGRQEEFVLWGLIVGIYFFWCLETIVARMPSPPRGMWLIPLALILLVFAITTPYLPEQLPLRAFLHVVFAFTAAVCLMVSIIVIIWKLYRQEPGKYRLFLAAAIGLVAGSAGLLAAAGIVSSALEVFFTIGCTVVVYRLYLYVE